VQRIQAKKLALLSILIFGLVSLLGDIVYEGARGAIPPFLQNLGASAFLVGLVLGLGEFLGYALRIAFGVLSDRTKSYWGFTIGGYSLLIAIPLLAISGSWHIAIILVMFERLSKAIRAPARDTLFSYATKGMGTGKAFGLHELMDQIGAIVGPAIVAVVLLVTGERFDVAFSILLIPFIIMLFALGAAYSKLRPRISLPTGPKRKVNFKKIPRRLVIYSTAVAFNSMGLVSIALVLYRASPSILPWAVSLLYLATQAVDAISAPIAGYIYDSVGRRLLYFPFVLSVIPSTLIFFGGLECVIASAILFGVIFGMHESIYRAAVADMTPAGVRGSAYGVFHTLYGLGFLIGGAVFGFFLDNNLFYFAIPYAVLTQALAIFTLHEALKS
jgi:MFS family permease